MTETPDILRRIVARKREQIAERQQQVPRALLEQRLADLDPARGFIARLRKRIALGHAAVIAEIKRASPSKGLLRADFHPAAIAQAYAAGGAACLSVLTETDFFQGADADLTSARDACDLPVIRKDFIVDPYQVVEARVMQADCILLITACLDDQALRELAALATEVGLDVLVEVHDAHELQRALAVPGQLIGINNRNLRSFEVDLNTTIALLEQIPEQLREQRVVVTESGIHSRQDVALMRDHGVHAFLVGESLMRADDPGRRLADLFVEA
jgi:indole-3-glycerol phosphate synthase